MKSALTLAVMAVAFSLASCASGPVNTLDIIPCPREMTPGKGVYPLSRGEVVYEIDSLMAPEAYTVRITPRKAVVKAGSEAGERYARQTLKQITAEDGEALLCCEISDEPRFAYRGLLLDCARHFYTTDEVKKVLDIMAFYKLNRFHWHLTDDHGWRIEIKKHPRLVEVGAFGDIGSRSVEDPNLVGEIRYEGFYTQEDIKDVVAYASSLGITVIPEIDMPGHMTSALAAYPQLGCTGGPYKVVNVVGPRSKGLGKENLCIGNDEIFDFISDIFDEILPLFPSEYIHIGGDECVPDRWDNCPKCQKRLRDEGLESDEYSDAQLLQNYFTRRVQKMLEERGRKIIGWDEILDGELDSTATVMSWRGTSGGKRAAERGLNAIMTPIKHCYLDFRQSDDREHEPIALNGTVSVNSVYDYEPCEGLSEEASEHIIGVQGNLWCDVVSTNEYLEYMLLPRLAALSEVQWCTPETKQWERFRSAMDRHARYYENQGYIYAKHLWGIIGLPGHEYQIPDSQPSE